MAANPCPSADREGSVGTSSDPVRDTAEPLPVEEPSRSEDDKLQPAVRYDAPEAIYARYITSRQAWYDAQPTGSIKTNQQYRKAMGLPQRYDKQSYEWCLDYKQMPALCVTSTGRRSWTKEEMMAYLDWSKAEDERVEAQVVKEMGDNLLANARRDVKEILQRIEGTAESKKPCTRWLIAQTVVPLSKHRVFGWVICYFFASATLVVLLQHSRLAVVAAGLVEKNAPGRQCISRRDGWHADIIWAPGCPFCVGTRVAMYQSPAVRPTSNQPLPDPDTKMRWHLTPSFRGLSGCAYSLRVGLLLLRGFCQSCAERQCARTFWRRRETNGHFRHRSPSVFGGARCGIARMAGGGTSSLPSSSRWWIMSGMLLTVCSTARRPATGRFRCRASRRPATLSATQA